MHVSDGTLSVDDWSPQFRAPEVLIPFYAEFVATFAHKLNPLRLAHIAVTVAEQFSDRAEAGAHAAPALLMRASPAPTGSRAFWRMCSESLQAPAQRLGLAWHTRVHACVPWRRVPMF